MRVYEKLITEDKVDVVLSPYGTAIHFAVAPIAEKYKAPIVGSTAASVKFRDIKTSYFWFITSALADRQMQAQAICSAVLLEAAGTFACDVIE